MARALWTGYLGFGLVNVPVGLYSATEDRTVHFNQLHKGTSHRIRYKKIDEDTGDEVASADIVNGFDLGDGEYVVVTRDELKAAAPGRSDAIEISDFVDIGEIDPIYFRQSYYLAPRTAKERTRHASAPPLGDGGHRQGGNRDARPPGQGAPRRGPSRRRGAGARDDVLRR